MAKGHSIAGFAGEIGVGRRTVFDWATTYPEFSAALEIATPKAVLFWEQKLIECAENGKGNVTACIFGLKNRAHEDWRDVQKIEHGRAGEFSAMTDQELDEYISRSTRAASISASRAKSTADKKGVRKPSGRH